MQQKSSIAIAVIQGDVLQFKADVLVLKHAQQLYGVDKAAYSMLSAAGVKIELPLVGEHEVVRSAPVLGPPWHAAYSAGF